MQTDAATVALMYPGQGGYTPGLLGRVVRRFPAVEPELARIRAVWLEETGEDLSVLWPDTTGDLASLTARSPGLSQIAIFAASVALHDVLASRAPDNLLHIGHSLGEIAALTCAGAWSVEAGTRVVAARVRSLAALSAPTGTKVVGADGVNMPLVTGGLTAASGGSDRIDLLVRAIGDPDLVIAGHNGPGQVVVSGPLPTIQRFEAALGALGARSVRIPSPYPFHSPMLAAAVPAFAAEIRAIGWAAPRSSVYSAVAGRRYRTDDDLAAMVAEQLVRPFDFGAAVRAQHAQGIGLFIECGGHRALTSAVRRTLGAAGSPASDWRAVAADELPEPAAAALRALDGTGGAGGGGVPGFDGHGVPLDGTAIRDLVRADLRADLWAIARELFAELGTVAASSPRPSHNGHPAVRVPYPAPPPAPDRVAEPLATGGPVAADGHDSPGVIDTHDRPGVADGVRDRSGVLATLVQMYAEALEYPPEVLEEHIELEGDLGVDSVKQTELMARVADRFALPPMPGDFAVADYPTLSHVADLVVGAAVVG